MKIKGLAATIRDLEAMAKVIGDRAHRYCYTDYPSPKKEQWYADNENEFWDAIAGLKQVRDSTMENYPPPCDKCGQSLPESD